jgi:hypothetical protein
MPYSTNSRIWRFLQNPISVGIVPVSKESLKLRAERELVFPNSVGSVPDIYMHYSGSSLG